MSGCDMYYEERQTRVQGLLKVTVLDMMVKGKVEQVPKESERSSLANIQCKIN